MSRFYGFVTLLVIIGSIVEIESSTSEVRFVSVVFRHGDRAPTPRELYPTDPYLNYDFHPMGHGGLTNDGKTREYAIGQELRKRYNDFLGDIYYPDDLYARSTNVPRTKMSLYLVLAGLYPPTELQKWNDELNWQPIPTSYELYENDVLLAPSQCPQYSEELERVELLPEVMEKVEKFRPLMNSLTVKTGRLMNDTRDLQRLYQCLLSESSTGLKLPEWTANLFPVGPINDAAVLDYEIRSYNEKLKRLNGGMLLRRISEDMIANSENASTVARKISLFSAHETNIAALLQTLGIYDFRPPAYSSAIFFELVRRGDDHYVNVHYYRGIPAIVETQTIPGCQELCPLADFLRLLKPVTPNDEEMACNKNPMKLNQTQTNPNQNIGKQPFKDVNVILKFFQNLKDRLKF